jgi:hypothetical protein
VKLLAEIAGVLCGGAAVAAALQLAGAPALRRPAGVAVVVVALASLLFFGNVWDVAKSMRAATRADRALSKQTAELAGGTGANAGFLAWARTRIVGRRQAPTFWLVPAAARNDGLVYQWSTYQLLPARATDSVREANWIVFYQADPSSVRYDRAAFRRLSVYAPGFAVAARTDGA